jgi:hypothetical protein
VPATEAPIPTVTVRPYRPPRLVLLSDWLRALGPDMVGAATGASRTRWIDEADAGEMGAPCARQDGRAERLVRQVPRGAKAQSTAVGGATGRLRHRDPPAELPPKRRESPAQPIASRGCGSGPYLGGTNAGLRSFPSVTAIWRADLWCDPTHPAGQRSAEWRCSATNSGMGVSRNSGFDPLSMDAACDAPGSPRHPASPDRLARRGATGTLAFAATTVQRAPVAQEELRSRILAPAT